MFGVETLDHEARYGYSEEWLDIALRLWEGGEDFDYKGRWLTVENGYGQPGPVQRPRPPIMNAAFSERGHRLAARYADVSFVGAFDPADARAKVEGVRRMAAEYSRELSVWINASVVCADTDREAEALIERWSDIDADDAAVRNMIDWTMGGAHMSDEQRRHLAKAMASTGGGYPLVGSPERIAEELAVLAEAGIDGVALTWFNYENGVPRFIADILPILEREDVRQRAVANA
jgi:alkanesulfonate monooxygenase SsuD/methylene tetrahydromethanopterin reductase-like flavin-dependent oxidoreductase (luciferase family)